MKVDLQDQYNGTVLSIREVHSDLLIMRVEPDFTIPEYEPGQYTVLGLGHWEERLDNCGNEIIKPGKERKLIKRAYSISSPVMENGMLLQHQEDFFEFYITLVRTPESHTKPTLTPRLFKLSKGDRIFVGQKIVGDYNLDAIREETENIVLAATGTGEAPHNKMIWKLLSGGFSGKLVSIVCSRYKKDLAYETVHRELEKQFQNFHYVPLTTREPENKDNKIYIQDFVNNGSLEKLVDLDPEKTDFFLCGNPAMIGNPKKSVVPEGGMVDILQELGFKMDQKDSKGSIHFEAYY
jgi:ferredoxin/flavodoxin---NADP+ reductase